MRAAKCGVLLKKPLPNNRSSTISAIFDNGKLYRENSQWFFCVGRQEVVKGFYVPNKSCFTCRWHVSKFQLQSVSVNFVFDALIKLKPNKAIGLDKLSARLLFNNFPKNMEISKSFSAV